MADEKSTGKRTLGVVEGRDSISQEAKAAEAKDAVRKQIETARNAKLVGSNLSAKVELWANTDLQNIFANSPLVDTLQRARSFLTLLVLQKTATTCTVSISIPCS